MVAFMPTAGMAQIGVGTTSLDATAMLQVNASASTNAKGFLGPRVALTSTSANSPFSVTPATGLMVYNTATAGTGGTAVTPGYYSYTGTGWERLAAAPVTFVSGSAGGFPIGGGSILVNSGDKVGYGPIGQIDLPPGRWEVVADYICVVTNQSVHNQTVYLRENTYWLANEATATEFYPNFPLSLPTSAAGPTSDAIFPGAATAFLQVQTHSGSSDGTNGFVYQRTNYPRQFMKFYINNSGSTNKTYYLHFHESYIVNINVFDSGFYPEYAPTTGLNKLYAIKIQ
jgi:hypothetical protein